MKNADQKSSPKTVPFTTVFRPLDDPALVQDLQKGGASFSFQRPPSPIGALILSWVPPPGLIWLSRSFITRLRCSSPVSFSAEELATGPELAGERPLAIKPSLLTWVPHLTIDADQMPLKELPAHPFY